jgi:two-component system nitrate/nitrite response regulator NarL
MTVKKKATKQRGPSLQAEKAALAQWSAQAKLASDISLILIEPNPLLREGVTRLLDSTRFDVVASFPTFEAIPASLEHSPDLILIGGASTALVTSILKNCAERYPTARRVVLNNWCQEHPMLLLDAGAHACLRSDTTIDVLVILLTLVMLDISIICRPTMPVADEQSLLSLRDDHGAEIPTSAGPDLDHPAHRLSTKEIAILQCLVHGDSNKLIARKIQISESTVKVHIKAILRKIRAANRTQAAIWAMTNLMHIQSDSESPPSQSIARLYHFAKVNPA